MYKIIFLAAAETVPASFLSKNILKNTCKICRKVLYLY